MATHFEIVHPVRQKPGKKEFFKRGTIVPASTFTDADAAPLVKSGTIKPLTMAPAALAIEETATKVLSAAKLAKLTKDELIAYAVDTYGLVIAGTKEELLAKIATAAETAQVLN